MEDVTEKRKISIALQESEKRFREVTNSLNDVLILIDTDLKVQLLNNAAITAYGVTDKNYIGKSCHEVFWNCGDVCENCPTLETMRTGKTFRAMRYMEDGTILDRTICPVHDQAGKIIASAIIASDVTERERQIEKLKRFEQIMSTSTDLIAFFDGQHRYLAANSEYANYFGISVDEIIGKHAAEVLGKDRYAWFLPYGETVFGEGKPVTLTTWIDYPVVGKRYMEVNLTPYLDGDGQVTGFVSRTVDITEKHEQDAKLRLSAAVFESTIEGIVITDADGVILAINQAFSEITGYTEADVLGENPRILKSDQHDTTFYQNMWQSLIDNGKWRGEVWNRRKTGEIYPELMTISSIRNDEGETINYVAVFTDITASKQAEDQLKYQAHHHPLTGLPNRLLLFARLEHSIQHVKRERERGAVMFLDLDNFKKVNDSLGHKAGDEVLKEVASRLQKGSREVDTVAHLGGDEFVIVMQSIRTVRDATTRAQQILDSLQKPFIVETYELYVSGSIGITEFTGAGENLESLLKNADSAMYKAKEEGKNCYQIYSSDLTEAAIEKVLLETHLRRALERNELVLHYQPQVDLPNGNIVAMEALVRWQHPDLGLLAPDKFISLSEETGLIIPMGEWILKTACEQLLIWRKQGYNLRRIAVNLSGKRIQQKNLLEVVERILLETGCPPDSLELEITEGFIMQHPEQSISVLQQIRALGVELSIDDFGTGHSSLNYLRRLPISRLKIDRTFVWDIGESSDGEAITKAVIAMGQSLNLQITAEGIETPEQRKFVEEHGCNEAQGYKFSRPLPAGEVSALLESATLGSAEVT
ncbi:MAG: EAL domain-containing protein, partial [Desulfuromusa sp.]|nr:EAL domain-containing protein [Desulfuromusa sp.]